MRIALSIRISCLILAAGALAGCAGNGGPGPEVQAARYRHVAHATFKQAVQDRYGAMALSGPSLLFSAGFVYSLDKDADGIVFVNDVCQNLFPNGLRTIKMSDVNEASVVRSRADGAVLTNLFGGSIAQAKDASVEIVLRGVEEQKVPPESLRGSLIDQNCRDAVRTRLQTEAAKPKQQRARIFVVMRAVKARDIYFDIAFKSATDASAALAVVSGKYQASIQSQITIRARPLAGFAAGTEAWAFGINRRDVSEIVAAPNNRIRLVPVAARKAPGGTQVTLLQ